ncbi:hypothetical protein QZH41_008250 [Actinostola sp. cb2023]|nr:hypothetical protein QZH41_008250 [Actinostola sp. cb2023]
MSRFRTDLRASLSQRKSTKFPPVQSEHVSRSPSASSQHWATDMVVGLQLKAASTPKDNKARGFVTSPKERIKEMVNSPRRSSSSVHKNTSQLQLQVDKLNQEINLLNIQLQELLDKIAKLEKENEKLRSKNSSQHKIIEQLKEQNMIKSTKITDLEELLKTQELIHKNKNDELICRLDDKDKRIKELEELLVRKNHDMEKMNTEFHQQMELKKKEYADGLEEVRANYEEELKVKDDKLKILKSRMADALKDNSRERQLQLEELTRELRKVSEEADILKTRMNTTKLSQGGCKNCHIFEKELQNKIIELRSKDVGLIELQRLCEKMEKQLMQQDELLRMWAKSKGKVIR